MAAPEALLVVNPKRVRVLAVFVHSRCSLTDDASARRANKWR
jgi:hypothetical protein